MRTFILGLFTLVPLTAFGSVVLGNPASKVTLATGPTSFIASVIAYPCDSGAQVVSIDATLSAGESVNVVLDRGLYCDIEFEVQWGNSGPMDTVPVSGFDKYGVVSGGPVRQFAIDATNQKITLL